MKKIFGSLLIISLLFWQNLSCSNHNDGSSKDLSTVFVVSPAIDPVPLGIPVYQVRASDHYDFGFQLGTLARATLQASLNEEAVVKHLQKANALDPAQIDSLIDAAKAFQNGDYAEEIRGLADGAQVSERTVWEINLWDEIDSLSTVIDNSSACTSILERKADSSRIVHSEDGGVCMDSKDLIVAARIDDEPGFVGFMYGFMLPGYAFGLNSSQVGLSVNSLNVREVDINGVGIVFLLRSVLSQTSVLDAIYTISTEKRAAGSSLNLAGLSGYGTTSLFQIEFNPDGFIATPVDIGQSMVHTNSYRWLSSDTENMPIESSWRRFIEATSLLEQGNLPIEALCQPGLCRVPNPDDPCQTMAHAYVDIGLNHGELQVKNPSCDQPDLCMRARPGASWTSQSLAEINESRIVALP